MKKLNNKGITTIEVLLCFVLVVIITVSMYGTISSFNQKRVIEQYKEKIYTYKELLTKEIQDDLIQIGVTHAKYEKIIVSSENRSLYSNAYPGTVVHTIDCNLKDGTTRQLRIYQAFAKAKSRISTNTAEEDYFMIEYGPTGSLMQYPIPDLGESPAFPEELTNTKKIKDLTINNILIKIENDSILSIYIGFYHPELSTRYFINIITPISYESNPPSEPLFMVADGSTQPRPATPIIGNSNDGIWVNKSYSISVSTVSPPDIVGNWYISNDNINYTPYNEATGLQSFNMNVEDEEQDKILYIKVCNKKATSGYDTANCSDTASTNIKIDKTPPTISYENEYAPYCCKKGSEGQNLIIIRLIVSDAGSGVANYRNVRSDGSTRADETFEFVSDKNYYNKIKQDYSMKTGKPTSDKTTTVIEESSPPVVGMGTSTGYIDECLTHACDRVGNCIYAKEQNGKELKNETCDPTKGYIRLHDKNSGFRSCESNWNP